jgi:hypothetical protein
LEILPKEFTFERENILIVQNGQRQTFGGELILDPNLATQVLIRRTDLPPHLKSIIVAVVDPTNQKQLYTYLLKLDPEGQAYVANIPPLRLSGESRLRVEIYDFEAAVVARYQTPVSLVTFDSANQITFEDRLVDSLRIFWYSIISLAFMGLFLIIWRRRQSD